MFAFPTLSSLSSLHMIPELTSAVVLTTRDRKRRFEAVVRVVRMFHSIGTIRVDTHLIIFMAKTGDKHVSVAKSTRRPIRKHKKPIRGGWDKFLGMFLKRFVEILQHKQKISLKLKRKIASGDPSLIHQQAVAELSEIWKNSKKNLDEATHTAMAWVQSQTKPNKTDVKSQFAPYV